MTRFRLRLGSTWHLVRPAVGQMAVGVIIWLGSSVAFICAYQNDLLIFAASQQNAKAIRVLIQLGAMARTSTEIFSEPALIEYLHSLARSAVRKPEEPVIVETLLNAGASVTERSELGWTPLMLAAASGALPVVEALVRHGAEIDARAMGEDQSEGMTPLMAAALHGHVETARYLAEHGANVHLRSHLGFTALLLAASRGHLDCVEMLLKKGALVPPGSLRAAQKNGHQEVVARLQAVLSGNKSKTFNRRPASLPEE